MPLIDVDDVQPWLSDSLIRLDSNDELPEEPIQSELVKSRLSACQLDTTTWIDAASTPDVVKIIVAMLVAAQRYNAVYSETEDDGETYGDKLEARAQLLMDGICAGSVELIGVDSPATTGTGSISFYPDDLVGLVNTEEAVRFTMGKVF